MNLAQITLFVLSATLCATPLSAQEQDRVAAFIETFDTYCLSRIGSDAPGTVPPGAREETTTAYVDGEVMTFTSYTLPDQKFSLTQEPKSCAVTTDEALPKSSVEALTATLGSIMARRLPDFRARNNGNSSWMLFRNSMDGDPGTQWGVVLIDPGVKDRPGMDFTSAMLVLSSVTKPDS